MKKKSKAVMIGATVAAVSLFAVTALAWTPNTSGYEAFKEVVKANHLTEYTTESATVKGNFTITADGETMLTANGTAKVKDAGEVQTVSSDFNLNLMGVERAGSVYSSGEDTVYFVDRTHDLHYQVINLDDEQHEQPYGHKREWQGEERFRDRPMNKAEEALLDYMVGDLKNNFTVTNHADGSKTIEVDVSEEEIPLALRLLIDAAHSEDQNERVQHPNQSEEWERLKQFPFFQGLEEGLSLEEQLPELTDDVAIERVLLQLTVDANNRLQRVQGELEVSGKDEAGASHRMKIECAGDIGAINATTPDPYEPSGQSIEMIDAESFDTRN